MARPAPGKRPRFHLVAGPNGAGKTTFARRFLPAYAGTFEFLNADLIAQGLAPLRPEAAALSAGKRLLDEMASLAAARMDFAAESTLAGASLATRLQALRRSGYALSLYFLWLPSLELARARVADRVRAGGHDIPEATIGRRFRTGLANLSLVYAPLFDDVRLFDNSGDRPRLVARRNGPRWVVKDRPVFARVMEAADERT